MWNTTLYDTTMLTVELRELIENGVNLWDFEYPSFYTGEDKKKFEQKVIDHFYFRQIGQETVGRFLHCFRSKVRDIMPYYVKLYESVKLMDDAGDPFEAYNLTETFQQNTSGRNTTSAIYANNATAEGTEKHSDTPQGAIDNVDNYMSNASKTDSFTSGDGSSESQNNNTGETSYTLTRRGNIGVQPLGQEINYYRDALINVDLMVINELNDLFLKIY